MSTVDDAALARLVQALEGHPRVVFARLFGSHGRGDAGPGSDVDVAIWLRDPQPDDDIAMNGLATDALHRDDVDAVVLNTASVTLAFEALKGRLLVSQDEGERIVAEAAIMSRYYDRLPSIRRHLAHAAQAIRERGFS